jgi:hypothetical protein
MDDYEELLRQIMIVKDRVRGVFHGQSTGMYLHGRPGTSKTYMVRSTLDNLAANYCLHNGHLTPIGLFDMIAENQSRIIVLDDVSAIFNQPIALQLLLAGLGNPHDGSGVRQVRYKTARETREVDFTGGIICLSNLSLDGHHHEVLAALKDRINVISYEPTDDQIIALIQQIAKQGVKDVSPNDCNKVAAFLVAECKARNIRPSVRLFVDKLVPDYKLWAEGKTETHWKDLGRSSIEQQVVGLEHDTRDLSRAEQTEAERRIALEIYLSYPTGKERVAAWKERTGRSQAAFYRRIKELQIEGRLPKDGESNAAA